MIIDKGSDLILRLELEDIKGQPLRVADTTSFTLKVFTTDEGNFIQFEKDEIIVEDDTDKIVLTASVLERLNSGVIAYSYSYGINNEYFQDQEYNKKKIVYTNFYYRNTIIPITPDNTISINGHKLNGDITLIPEDLGLGYVDNTADLDKPISTATQAALDSLDADINTEVTRATQSEQDLANAINTNRGNIATLSNELYNEITNRTNAEATLNDKIDNKANIATLDAEITRAKKAEKDNSDAITAEINRATNAESGLSNKIDTLVNSHIAIDIIKDEDIDLLFN